MANKTRTEETTMATYSIESVKGNVTVDTLHAAAEWIAEYQPAFASINGESIDYTSDDDAAAIRRAIERALTTDERIEALRSEAGEAGDSEMVDACTLALDGDDDARAKCTAAMANARAQEEV